MAEIAYDDVAETRLLEAAGFDGKQAEAVVNALSRAMVFSRRLAENQAQIKAQMATKTDLAELRAYMAESFERMQRSITIGVVAICGLIIGLIPTMLLLR